MKEVIVIIGRIGSGKSTLAEIIKSHRALTEILPVAKSLKDVALSMGWNGKKDQNGRRLLQTLGTECGRKCIGENVWIDIWYEEAYKLLSGNNTIIVDDVRFHNELDKIYLLQENHQVKVTVVKLNKPAHNWQIILGKIGHPSYKHLNHRSETEHLEFKYDIEIGSSKFHPEFKDYLTYQAKTHELI